MKADVTQWCEVCVTCLRFRRIPKKGPQVSVLPVAAECWQEVMIDLEGPNNPADSDGNKYVMTYICTVCQGILLERSAKCNATEARRMFAACVLRSGTIPTVLRSDNGPEFKNALMKEYAALVGLNHRFGTPWRPMEQGLVERKHKETMKIMGMLVKDVLRCLPHETGELLHLVEFIVYNTPGPHGFTPRDIDRRWSATTPLEKELQPFEVGEFEPVQEYVANLFRTYREIREVVLSHLRRASTKRAELANRWRKEKKIRVGDRVVLRDPRHRSSGGRTPYKKPLTEPVEVVSTTGNRLSIRRKGWHSR